MEGPQSLPVQMPEPSPPPRSRRVEPEGAVGIKINTQTDKELPKSREPREYRDYTASPVKLSRYIYVRKRPGSPTF
jgi:hypothetical protein